jgi:hypothetical protein
MPACRALAIRASNRGASWSDFRFGSEAIHSGRPKPAERALAEIQRAFLQRFGSLKKPEYGSAIGCII